MTHDPSERLFNAVVAALRDAADAGLSVGEIGHRLGDAAVGRTALRGVLKALCRDGRAVRVDRDLYAAAPPALAEQVRATAADEEAAAAGAAPLSRAEARERALRFVDPDGTNVRTLLDQLAHGLDVDRPFTDEATREAERARAPLRGDEAGDDLTHLGFVTIDGADAKDFDDAVYAEALEGGAIRLWVGIADVSAYVAEDGPLDADARERGCSMYFPGRVYPMLPFHLADDVCSLRPDALRRCAWVRMDIDAAGVVVGEDFGFGVMRSQARLTYETVQDVLDGRAQSPHAEMLRLLDALRARLFERRRERGMLDLDLPEPRVALTADGLDVAELEPYPRLSSHRLIEECMLVTNETVAAFLIREGWPALFRVHGEPSVDRLRAIRPILLRIAPSVRLPEVPRPADLERAIEATADSAASSVVSSLILRSLPRAQYAVTPSLHFGLGTDQYLHFTSPIRRYPDLEVHRVLRAVLAARRQDPGSAQRALVGPARDVLVSRLALSAEKSNAGENTQNLCERHSARLMRALFMRDKVGETYDAVITDVAPFGVFVTVQHPFVDGLVPVQTLGDDFFEWVERLGVLVGERSRKRFGVGDAIEVVCVSSDVRAGKVTFAPVGFDPRRARGRSAKPRVSTRDGGKPGSDRRAPGGRPAAKPPRPKKRRR